VNSNICTTQHTWGTDVYEDVLLYRGVI